MPSCPWALEGGKEGVSLHSRTGLIPAWCGTFCLAGLTCSGKGLDFLKTKQDSRNVALVALTRCT